MLLGRNGARNRASFFGCVKLEGWTEVATTLTWASCSAYCGEELQEGTMTGQGIIAAEQESGLQKEALACLPARAGRLARLAKLAG